MAKRDEGAIGHRVALVTGASSGIGKQLALRLARLYGYAVGLVARTAADLDRVASEISERGGRALALPADVSNWDDAHRAVSHTVQVFGRLDLLVNAAGVSYPGPFEGLTREEVEAMMGTNVLGTVACLHAAIPALAASKGTVVNISSMAGLVGVPGLAVYSATKWAVSGLSEALRAELSSKGIRVMAVYPTYVSHTRMLDFELQRGPLIGYSSSMVMTAEQVADRVLEALMHGREHVVIGPRSARFGLRISSLFPSLRNKAMARMYARSITPR